ADCATSISSVAGASFGKVKRPRPERWVADALAELSEEDIAAIEQALPALEKLTGILKEQP
ncbi:hypothetical protein ABT262_27130, partial [Amycolatopsis mediterranei]